ncbi:MULTISPECIES: ABC transporter permease subunit [Aminobacterium]|nr:MULTISPECIES: ABC transporter [Aminobacterium]MDD2378759.1 ABC transporter permease [Aminobacterium colombiense]MDD3767476.1 ABC transporter permease [Aminobacterium colombiense]MDD4265172.1 ABC transporter permease [Aminobacterium colombiense]MDD4585378.1 ABC transporter permease [Aminobacterium colombiense]NLK30109.1 ABC transporter permease [Aminobacterium colombiense]
MNSLRNFVEKAGWPRVIIGLFLIGLFVMAPFVRVRVDTSISDTLVRFGMNGVMVLAMVPMIQAGCGLNFGLPLGIIAGLLGAVTSIEIGITGLMGVLTAMAIAAPIAVVLGWLYGQLLNRVKGGEMMIATYVGFSSVAFMCIMWLVLPYKSPNMVWGYAGTGLRTTISVDGYWNRAISDILSFKLGNFFYCPTGMILFFALLCFVMWLFMKTRVGTAMTTVGSNPEYAKAAGVDVNKMRTLSVILSTVLGAIGIIIYEQSFGFIQLYMGPFYMAFPAVAAILIGGASVNKASIFNVVVGTILFQGILTMTPSVINSLIETDMSEVIRIIVSNGMILYALTRAVKVKS